jgi:hypothetical protein
VLAEFIHWNRISELLKNLKYGLWTLAQVCTFYVKWTGEIRRVQKKKERQGERTKLKRKNDEER